MPSQVAPDLAVHNLADGWLIDPIDAGKLCLCHSSGGISLPDLADIAVRKEGVVMLHPQVRPFIPAFSMSVFAVLAGRAQPEVPRIAAYGVVTTVADTETTKCRKPVTRENTIRQEPGFSMRAKVFPAAPACVAVAVRAYIPGPVPAGVSLTDGHMLPEPLGCACLTRHDALLTTTIA